jgi:hypothetical protein
MYMYALLHIIYTVLPPRRTNNTRLHAWANKVYARCRPSEEDKGKQLVEGLPRVWTLRTTTRRRGGMSKRRPARWIIAVVTAWERERLSRSHGTSLPAVYDERGEGIEYARVALGATCVCRPAGRHGPRPFPISSPLACRFDDHLWRDVCLCV